MLNKISFPQNLTELSSISRDDLLVDKWSGAVVFLVIEEELVLIKRSFTMPTHKGQIAFMGGHKLVSEKDPIQTALREFEEESSLSADLLKVHGLIHPVLTARKRMIIPVICEFKGTKSEFLGQVNSNGEWDDLVLSPINYLRNSELWTRAVVSAEQNYSVYFAPLLPSECTYFNSKASAPYLLWGASAKMILNFFQKHLDSDK